MTNELLSKLHLDQDTRSLAPGNPYLVKRLVKIVIELSIMDLAILLFTGTMLFIPVDEVEPAQPDPRSMIWFLGLATALIISAIVLTYSAVATPWLVRTLSYEITDEALLVKRGRLTKVEIFVPYRTITNIGMTRGPLDRVFNIGHLSVETAGTALPVSGKLGVDQYVEGLDYSILQDVHGFIYSKMKKLKSTYATTTENTVSESSAGTADEELPVLIKSLIEEIRNLRNAVTKLQ